MAYRTWTSAIALAIGASFIAGAAGATDYRDGWSGKWWDKDVEEDVDIDVEVDVELDPDGWVELQIDQRNYGDVTANAIYDGTFSSGWDFGCGCYGGTSAEGLPVVEISNSAFGNAIIGETETATTLDIRQKNEGDVTANTGAYQWDWYSDVAFNFDTQEFEGAAEWYGGVEAAMDVSTVAAGNLVNISMLEDDDTFFMADVSQYNSGNVSATTVVSQDLSGYHSFNSFQLEDELGEATAGAGVVASITNLAAGNIVSFDVGSYVDVGQDDF